MAEAVVATSRVAVEAGGEAAWRPDDDYDLDTAVELANCIVTLCL